MAMHTARRLTAMAENIQAIVVAEFQLAAQTYDYQAPHKSSPLLQKAKDLLRSEVQMLVEDRRLKPEFDLATKMVREGTFIEAVGMENLPKI